MAEIIKIVIKGSSGYGSYDESYNDKVTITPESIAYEYVPAFESEINCNRKWSYKTNSPIFKMKYKAITRLISDVIDREIDDFCTDIGGIEFIITYSDKTRYKNTFWVPGEYFVPLFDEIKNMVPECEYTPAVLLTEENFEKE